MEHFIDQLTYPIEMTHFIDQFIILKWDILLVNSPYWNGTLYWSIHHTEIGRFVDQLSLLKWDSFLINLPYWNGTLSWSTYPTEMRHLIDQFIIRKWDTLLINLLNWNGALYWSTHLPYWNGTLYWLIHYTEMGHFIGQLTVLKWDTLLIKYYRIRTILSESSLCAFLMDKGQILFMRTTKTDQTVRTRRLIWVFIGRTCQKIRFLTSRLKYLLICRMIWLRIWHMMDMTQQNNDF